MDQNQTGTLTTFADYLFLSLLFDDCLERGNGIFNGGVRYLGGTVESYGNTNVADSLVAIRNLVFEEKKLSIKNLKLSRELLTTYRNQTESLLQTYFKKGGTQII